MPGIPFWRPSPQQLAALEALQLRTRLFSGPRPQQLAALEALQLRARFAAPVARIDSQFKTGQQLLT